MNASVLDGPPFPGATDTALHLVSDQENAVAVANAAQFLHEDGGSNDISTFALHRLDKDCGHFLGGKRSLKELVFDEAGAAQREGFGILRSAFASAIYIWITDVSDARNQWAEAPFLLRFRGGERKRTHGASMERAEKCNHVLPLGVIASEFESALDGFRARVAVVDFVWAGHRSDLREPLREGHHVLVIKIGAGHMNQFGCLFLNRRDHMGMAVTGRCNGDACREVEEFISIHVGDYDTASLLCDQRIGTGIRRRNIFAVPF